MKTIQTSVLSSIAVLLVANTGHAADRFWTNNAGGTFGTALNWSPNAVPGLADNAFFTNNASYSVSLGANAATHSAFFNASAGIVTQAVGGFIWQVTNSYMLGAAAGQSPTVTHASGTLRVTNAPGVGVLEVRNGTNRLDGGTVEADRLLLTNSAGRVVFNGGTLITRSASISNGAIFSVGANAGFGAATWVVLSNALPTALQSDLYIGNFASGARLLITNGGTVRNVGGSIGFNYFSSSNTAIVSGPGSLWDNSDTLEVGREGSFNTLLITNSGLVRAAQVILGSQASSSNNVLTLAGGALVCTNAAATAVLDVRRGTNRIDGGTIETDRLLLTNSAGRLVFNGGTLITRGGTVNNGAGFAIGSSGSTPAIWDVRAGADTVLGSSFTNGFAVPGSQLLITNGGRLVNSSATVGSTASSTGNQVLIAGTGSTWTNSSIMDLGINGGFNQLVVSNSGQLFNSSTYVGFNASSPSNRVVLTGTGSLWDNRTDTRVGSSGPFNELWVTDNATKVARQLTIGFNASSTNNRVVLDGGNLWVTNTSGTAPFDIRRGTNELLAGYVEADRLLLTNSAGAFLFNGGKLVTRGVTLTNGAGFVVGDTGAIPATWDVRAGAPNIVSSFLIVGSAASHARMLLTNGAALTSDGGILGSNNGANSNAVLIAGPGSVWTNTAFLQIGREGAHANSLVVSNGGVVFNSETRIGDSVFFFASHSNVVQVTGPGSRLHNSGRLSVGVAGDANRLEITDDGEATATNCIVGVNSTSTGNRLLVADGTLRVTNVAQTAELDIRRGTNVLLGGVIEADFLRLTSTAGRFEFPAGLLALRGALVSNGVPFLAGNGSDAAALQLAGNGLHRFAHGLTLANNATLTGNGTLSGPLTTLAGSTVTPGASIGGFTLSNAPFLAGTLILEISRDGSTLTNDRVNLATGTLTYGGSLIVNDLGPDPLLAGNSFKLFDAPAYAGSFANLTLPALDPGLFWTNKLLVDGSIEVSAIPPGDRFWTNSLGGPYQTAANWSPNFVPRPVDNAVFPSNASYQVTWAADAVASNAFFTASSGTVTQAIGGFTWLLTNSYVLGPDAGQLPTVRHTSGTLRVTNAAGMGVLEVRNGTNRLSGGVVEADQLVLTNSTGQFVFDGGTLVTRSVSVSNGTTFVLGNTGTTPAIWDVRAGGASVLSSSLTVGQSASGNQLYLTNGAVLLSNSGNVGNALGSSNNLALISGAGSVWSNSSALSVGGSGSFNQLTIRDGGKTFSSGVNVGSSSAARSNQVLITGPASRWESGSISAFNVGNQGSQNQLVVSNGGAILNSFSSFVGQNSTAHSNVMVVVGVGSVSSNSSLTVGSSGSHNQLRVADDGLVAATSLILGGTSSSTNNRVTVDGGTLRVTNAAQTASFDIRRGTNEFNSGLIEANALRLTNTLGVFVFNGGTFRMRTATVANGLPFTVGNGASTATYFMTAAATSVHAFADGLILSSNTTLTGNGTLSGALTTLAGSTVSPGNSAGRIVLNNSPSLSGTLLMEISKTGSALTNDVVQLTSGTLTYGGTLVVTNIGPDALVAGNSFKLFDAPGYADSFASLTLPLLAGGLLWNNKLLVDGSVEVIVAPPPVEFNLTGIAGPGLRSDNENPPTFGGTGGEFSSGIFFEEGSGLLTVNVAWGTGFGFLDATGPVNVAHVHGPTPSNYGNGFTENAGVVFALTPNPTFPGSGFISQSVGPLSPTQKAQLFAGRFYINLHTALNPGGEMRGFLVPAAPLPPAFATIANSGADVVMTGSGGFPGGTYYVLTATNVTQPIVTWTAVATNQFNGVGTFTFTNAITPGTPRQFYLLSVP